MIDPAILDAMLAAGASADVIVAAVKADQAKEEMRRESKRANNAERQRRFREAHNGSNALRDVTDVTPPAFDKETSPRPPKEINSTPRAQPTRARPDTRLPDDWQPEPLITGSPTAQIVAAWQPGRLERELSKFRDHYRAAPGAKGLARDWQAKWRTWIGNADGFGGSGGAIRQNRGTGARSNDGFGNALREAAEHFAAQH